MIRRDGQSDFVESLRILKRTGRIVVASKKVAEGGIKTEEDAKTLLNKFDKSEDIHDEYIQEHHDRLEKGHDPKEVVGDFFKNLQENTKSNKQMTIRTAKLFRQNGIFKKADRDVYQNAETGDFWKISEDGKNVLRLFKEVDGVAQTV